MKNQDVTKRTSKTTDLGWVLRLGFVLAVLIQVAAATNVAAATIRVERNGSGDFTEIQPALAAAASGDTLMIGPGEYTEYNTVRLPGYTWDVDVFAYVQVAELTIIGAGADQTIIGPSTLMRDYDTFSAKCLVWLDGLELRLTGVTLRNCYEGMHVSSGLIYVENCRLLEHRIGILWQSNTDGGHIVNTEISSNASLAFGVDLSGSGNGVLFETVTTRGCANSVKSQQNVLFERCDISAGAGGIGAFLGADVTVRDCQIYDCSSVGISVFGSAGCLVENSSIASDSRSIWVDVGSELSVDNSIIEGGAVAAVFTRFASSITINNSHIFKGSGHAVYCDELGASDTVTYDMTNNYWGTASGLDIIQSIWDRLDNVTNRATVEWFPFSSEEVSNESMPWGSVKSMFR